MDFYVYIINCSDGSYYIGHTNNIDKRLSEHNEGTGSFHTRLHRPFELVYLERYQTRKEAFWVERKLKAWSRKKKEALISKDWNELSNCSKKRFE